MPYHLPVDCSQLDICTQQSLSNRQVIAACQKFHALDVRACFIGFILQADLR